MEIQEIMYLFDKYGRGVISVGSPSPSQVPLLPVPLGKRGGRRALLDVRVSERTPGVSVGRDTSRWELFVDPEKLLMPPLCIELDLI